MSGELLSFSIYVMGPVVLLLALGKWLMQRAFISPEFVANGSSLVFNIALPALLFLSISQADFQQAANSELITLGVSATLGFFVLSLVIVQRTFSCREDRGVIVQGCFRANLGVIGLAFAAKTFNPADFAQASVYMGALIVLFNTLSVWVLSMYLPTRISAWQTLNTLSRNPIMLAILAALLVSYFQIDMPKLVTASVGYLAQLTLPLALICTGASIRFRDMRGQIPALAFTVVSKCILYPAIMILLGLHLNLEETELLTVLFMSAAPTAAVSFIMVKQMGGNADLAANIVALTTVISIPTTLLGYQWVLSAT
ncbi:AEC family transporter [Alteromonas flava]|uniref:AEC family transporter n=1 Tax=Alteromonas flava TaxID=2048003 RepID=UPI000C28FF87|nr:AEC family transporter [Alteromonas flava]